MNKNLIILICISIIAFLLLFFFVIKEKFETTTTNGASCDTKKMIHMSELRHPDINKDVEIYNQPIRSGSSCDRPVKLTNVFKYNPENTDRGPYISQFFPIAPPIDPDVDPMSPENPNNLKICPFYDGINIDNIKCFSYGEGTNPATVLDGKDMNNCITIQQGFEKNPIVVSGHEEEDGHGGFLPLPPLTGDIGQGINCTFNVSGAFGNETVNVVRDPYQTYGYYANTLDYDSTKPRDVETKVSGASNYMHVDGVNQKNDILGGLLNLSTYMEPTEYHKRQRATYLFLGDKIDNSKFSGYNFDTSTGDYSDHWDSLCNVSQTLPSSKNPESPCCPKNFINGGCYCENIKDETQCNKARDDSMLIAVTPMPYLQNKTQIPPLCIADQIAITNCIHTKGINNCNDIISKMKVDCALTDTPMISIPGISICQAATNVSNNCSPPQDCATIKDFQNTVCSPGCSGIRCKDENGKDQCPPNHVCAYGYCVCSDLTHDSSDCSMNCKDAYNNLDLCDKTPSNFPPGYCDKLHDNVLNLCFNKCNPNSTIDSTGNCICNKYYSDSAIHGLCYVPPGFAEDVASGIIRRFIAQEIVIPETILTGSVTLIFLPGVSIHYNPNPNYTCVGGTRYTDARYLDILVPVSYCQLNPIATNLNITTALNCFEIGFDDGAIVSVCLDLSMESSYNTVTHINAVNINQKTGPPYINTYTNYKIDNIYKRITFGYYK
jgi:hypothetical protein